jgi:hypothetical protein
MTGDFLVPLSFLKFGILGYVRKVAAPLASQLGMGGGGLRIFFSPPFLGLMNHLLQMGALKWYHQMTDL